MRTMAKSLIALFAALVFTATAIPQQKAEVTISLNEAFFDAALEALFVSGAPLEFSIAENRTEQAGPFFVNSSYTSPLGSRGRQDCAETIRIQRELNGVRTAVRFREGKIIAPLAFTGSYNPPFVGCVPFSGWAESVIDLEFDQSAQRLVARARVLNVSLSGTGGIGGAVVAKLVQGSIDKKVNPIQLLMLNKLSFGIPVNGSELQMKATAIRHELHDGVINIVVTYVFTR